MKTKKTPAVEWNPVEIPTGPWTVYPHTPERNLWSVKTSMGLVIGPIFGKEIAVSIAATPDLLALARQYASECSECDGTGADAVGHEDACEECAHIRKVISKATKCENATRGNTWRKAVRNKL